MDFLTGAQILGADDLVIEEVEVLGGKVRVKQMSLTDKDLFERSLYVIKNGKVTPAPGSESAKLLAHTLCNEKGERLIADSAIAALGGKNAQKLAPAILKARELNDLTRGKVEDAKKNSSETGESDLSTDSPGT